MTMGENDGHTVSGMKVDDAVGQVLGRRYRLVAPIGSGASARVYAAEDLSLGRKVAVKVLRTGLTDDVRFVKRFRAEAKAAAQLSHPNLLAVFDWGEDSSAAFIVTEVLLGGSLRDMLDRSSLLTPSQGLLVALQVAQGLSYAHRLGWVHRDIKPANLLFGEDGRLRIADFGIARAVAEAAWTEPEGVLIGTARYAAPEQALGEVIDGKADVYSLGLTVIEAITGDVPLLRDNALGTMLLRQDEDVGDLSDLGPLGGPLSWAGRADPQDRPSAPQLIDALTRAARLLARPRRLPLAGTRLGLEDRQGEEPTMLLSSRPSDSRPPRPGHEPTYMLYARQGESVPDGPGYEQGVRFSSNEPPEGPPEVGIGRDLAGQRTTDPRAANAPAGADRSPDRNDGPGEGDGAPGSASDQPVAGRRRGDRDSADEGSSGNSPGPGPQVGGDGEPIDLRESASRRAEPSIASAKAIPASDRPQRSGEGDGLPPAPTHRQPAPPTAEQLPGDEPPARGTDAGGVKPWSSPSRSSSPSSAGSSPASPAPPSPLPPSRSSSPSPAGSSPASPASPAPPAPYPASRKSSPSPAGSSPA
jgi:serine/threonine protein kinase